MSTTTLSGIDPKAAPHIVAVRAYLIASGGVATYGELVDATSCRAVKHARRAGAVVLGRRGLYALPDADAVASSAPLDQTAFDADVLDYWQQVRAQQLADGTATS